MTRLLLVATLLIAGSAPAVQAGVFSPSSGIDELQAVYGIEIPGLEKLPVSRRTGPRLFSSSPEPRSDNEGPFMRSFPDGSREYGRVAPEPEGDHAAGETGVFDMSPVAATPESGNLRTTAGAIEIPAEPIQVIERKESAGSATETAMSPGTIVTPGLILWPDAAGDDLGVEEPASLPGETPSASTVGTPHLEAPGGTLIDIGETAAAAEPVESGPGFLHAGELALDDAPRPAAPATEERVQLVPEPSMFLLATVAVLAGAACAWLGRRR